MTDSIETILALVALYVGLPLLVLWVRDRVSSAIRQRRRSPERVAAERTAYEEQILHPDWAFYERHLQRQVPKELRELYANWALVTRQDLYYADFERITTFEPLNEQGLLDIRPQLGFDAVPIATGQFGDPIYLRPGSSEGDLVYITHHDGGDTEVFAESVRAMLEQLRLSNRAVNKTT